MVTVKVLLHAQMVLAALDAGTMIYCEWPLGNGQAEALRLSQRAIAAGVRTVCGLQARFSPAIRYAHDLIAEGYIGEVLATTLVGSGHLWGAETPRQYAYAFDASNGATLVSVPVLHALDALNFVIADFESVTASSTVRRHEVRIIEDESTQPVTAPDHVAIAGILRGGAVASVFYRGGFSRGQNLRWEINGSKGDLVFSADTGIVQVADLKLEGGRKGDVAVREIRFLRDTMPSFRICPRAGHATSDTGTRSLRRICGKALGWYQISSRPRSVTLCLTQFNWLRRAASVKSRNKAR